MSYTLEDIQQWHERYMAGATLRELGEENSLTHERIRQLFVENGLAPKKFKRQTISRYEQEFSAWERKDEIIEAYKEHGTTAATAKAVDLPRNHVAAVLADYPLRHLYRRKGSAKAHSLEFVQLAVKTAAELCGEPLTIPAYRKVAPAHNFPSDLTVIRTLAGDEGTWEAACRSVGVKANPAEGTRRGSITREQCLEAICDCLREADRMISYDYYSKWAKEYKRPSGPTIRVRVGPWSKALLLAQERLTET